MDRISHMPRLNIATKERKGHMKFSEKLKKARTSKDMSQVELAKIAGITTRTLQNYESGEKLPRRRSTYTKLAEALGVSEDTLMDENASFVIDAYEMYGPRGASQADNLVRRISAMWAGGEMAEEDIEENMRALQEAYWTAKKINRKYVPKMYSKKDSLEGDGSL